MAVKFRDYYEVLGAPHAATAEEIKKRYRKVCNWRWDSQGACLSEPRA
jgi:preprotein translocase subunit Sec63